MTSETSPAYKLCSFEKLLLTVSSFSALLFFSLSLSLHKGYTYGTILLLIPTLFALPYWWRNKKITQGVIFISCAFLFFAFIDILKAFSQGTEANDFERALKYLLTILILLYLTAYPPKPNFIWWGVALGAIGTGFTAAFYTWIAPEALSLVNQGRASPYLNPIQYGNLSSLLAILALCGYGTSKGILRYLLAIAVLAGLLAALLSLSRGSWLSFLITAILLCVMNFRKNYIFSRKFIIFMFLSLFFIGISSYFYGNKIQKRIAAAKQELIYLYEHGKPGNNSIGLRLQMWEFAIHEGLKKPLLGVDKKQLETDKQAWVKQGKAHQTILRQGHFHNEFLNTFAKKGFLGLAALLALFLIPLYFFIFPYRHISKKHQKINALRIAGTAHIVMFMCFGLTEVSLDVYNSALLMFLITLVFLYSSYISELEKIIRPSLLKTKKY